MLFKILQIVINIATFTILRFPTPRILTICAKRSGYGARQFPPCFYASKSPRVVVQQGNTYMILHRHVEEECEQELFYIRCRHYPYHPVAWVASPTNLWP